MPELAHDDLECAIGDREVLDVSFVPVDVGFGNPPVLPRAGDQIRREVDPGDIRAETGGRDRDDTRSTRHVEHAVASAHTGVPDEVRRRRRGDRLEGGKVRPPLLLGFLELGQRVHGVPRSYWNVTLGTCCAAGGASNSG